MFSHYMSKICPICMCAFNLLVLEITGWVSERHLACCINTTQTMVFALPGHWSLRLLCMSYARLVNAWDSSVSII